MKLARARHEGEIVLERLDDGAAVSLASGEDHPAVGVLDQALDKGLDLAASAPCIPVEAVTVLAPVRNPAKVLCVGLDYAAESEVAARPQPDFTPEAAGFAWTPPVFLKDGEVVEVEIEGLALFSDRVRSQ